ncbi:S-layer homology domain-containing protein [Candidatus Peribacteria bacterium]|nr:S-layer homology domain-containing protein [Candidatus Peribacteria bacterium]
MKYAFSRTLTIATCLLMTMTAMAYTSTDCTNVEQLATQGVVSYKNTCREYNLDRTISRQEVAAVALKVGEICGAIQNVPPTGQYYCDNIFSDVSSTYPNDWVCRVAETLARDGIISQNDTNQYGDVFFRPLKNVTRAEALAMVLNAGNLEFQSVTYDDWRFTGTGAVTWQKPLMQYAYDRGIISSISTFGPNTNAFRRDVFNYATAAINLCRGNNGNYNYNNNYNNNNYYNTNCGIGQYASGNTCYTCNTAPANAYYATANSCIWTCNSGYYKSGNTCIANYNNYYGTTGQCGTTINSCLSGTFYDTTDYGNYAYWNCTGTNGTSVSCSAYNNNYYGTTGQCGTTINSCLSGTFYDTTDYGNYAYWNCTGTNGTSVSCSAYNNNYYGTTGQCGTTINSCLSGTFYDTTDYGNYAYWNCTGTNGTSVSCSAYNNNYYGTTGQCGTTINSCLSGTFYDTTDYGNYAYWNCTGTNGTSVSCSAYNNNYNSTCGVGQYYTGNMCIGCTSKPSYAYYTTSGTCDWTCNSGYYKSGNTCVSNYNNTYCSPGQYLSGNTCYSCGTAPYNAYYTTSGSCDWTCNSGYYKNGNTCTSDYNNYGTTGQCGYTANSCTVGYLSNTTYSGGYTYWNCTGTNNVPVSCNVYGNNYYYGTTGQCGTTINSCLSGTFYDTTDYGNYAYWNCTGTNGTSVSCSAYNNNYNNNNNYYNNCSISMPSNAYYTNSQSCWSCNQGYVQINNLCVWWN